MTMLFACLSLSAVSGLRRAGNFFGYSGALAMFDGRVYWRSMLMDLSICLISMRLAVAYLGFLDVGSLLK